MHLPPGHSVSTAAIPVDIADPAARRTGVALSIRLAQSPGRGALMR
jgi:hypothetical protein